MSRIITKIIVKILPKLAILILFVLLLMAGSRIVRAYRKEKNWKKLVQDVLLQMSWFRVTTILAAGILTGLFGFYHRREAVTKLLVTLNYAEASNGQNANGTRYNMSEIISEDVIGRAIEKGALENVTIPELADCFSVFPLVQGDSYDKENYHIASNFAVTFKPDKNTWHLNSEQVALLLGYAYKEFYIEHYVENYDMLDISIDCQQDYADLDYMDILKELEFKADKIMNYMYSLAEKSPAFVSSDGVTFLSLADRCSNIRNILLGDNLTSYLQQNGISKNGWKYAMRLDYENSRYDQNYQKAIASFQIRNQAVAMYTEDMLRVVLIPTWDADGKFYMGQTKVGLDTLLEEAEVCSRQAAELERNMQTNRSSIDTLRAAGKSGLDIRAEAMIENISEELMSLAKEARKAGKEYSQTRMNQCISVTVEKESFFMLMTLCGCYFLLSYLACCILLKKIPKEDKSKTPLQAMGHQVCSTAEQRGF